MDTPRPQHENKLWIARKKAGLEQKSVARLMGYKSISPISAYETGRLLPSLSTALRLSIIYNTPLPELYAALYAEILPGNSGGPLLTSDGQVAGVVFAAAVDNNRTGYALTSSEVSGDANAARSKVLTKAFFRQVRMAAENLGSLLHALVEGEVVRTVVWPGAIVTRREHLVDAVRAHEFLTVLVR